MTISKDNQQPICQATPVYLEVSTDETYGPDLGVPLFTTSEAYRHIPEARELTWTDDFFEDDDDVVAVFDLDYDSMESFYISLGWVGIGLSILYAPVFAIAAITLTPCFLKRNVQWAVRAKHVAITRDGIRFVENRRPCGWGLACCDSGKKSKTVPFDKITDCDIVEPAGNECICIPRILFKVHIDTASSSKESHELVLAGLKDPHSFKKLVWAMKRAQQQQQLQHPSSLEMMRALPSLVAAGNDGSEDITSLLKEIRDELRKNNETLQIMKSSQTGAAQEEEGSFV